MLKKPRKMMEKKINQINQNHKLRSLFIFSKKELKNFYTSTFEDLINIIEF